MPTIRSLTVLAVALAVALLAAGPAEAKKKKKRGNVPTEVGTYTDWNGDIDRLEIVESFSAADYSKLVVGEFATDGVPLPEADDNAYEPVKTALADVATPLANGVREGSDGFAVETGGEGDAGGEGTLLLRGRVLEMDPGSKAARYWAGFGAGAARTKVEGELVDAASGRVLLRFTQERRSGVGAFGGGYVELLRRNLFAIGEDVGAGLTRF